MERRDQTILNQISVGIVLIVDDQIIAILESKDPM